jgi:hypothetical protein
VHCAGPQIIESGDTVLNYFTKVGFGENAFPHREMQENHILGDNKFKANSVKDFGDSFVLIEFSRNIIYFYFGVRKELIMIVKLRVKYN